MTKRPTATRTRWTVLAALALIALSAVTFARVGSTTATFSDRVTSADNTLSTASLQAPTLATSVSGTTVTLSWNNPDSLSGASAGFTLMRAAGACTAPGAFAAITGSPFAITTLSTTNVPGTGTFCYRVQSTLSNWTSPVGTSASVNWEPATVAAPVTAANYFLSKNSNDYCGDYQLQTALDSNSGSGDDTVAKGGGSRTWTMFTTNTKASVGTGTFTFNILGQASANVSLTIQVGYCANGTGGNFVSLAAANVTFTPASSTGNFVLRTFTGTVATAHTFTGTQALAVRIINTDSNDDLKIILGNPSTATSTVAIP